MGVTVMVGLMVWIAGSLVEYKIITAIPSLKKIFHGLPGIIISIGIGAIVAFFLNAGVGAGIMLGQLLGLATNQFTFAFFTNLAILNEKRREFTSNITSVRASHPKLFTEVAEGVKTGVKVMVGVVLAALYLCALPFRAIAWITRTYNAGKTKFSHS